MLFSMDRQLPLPSPGIEVSWLLAGRVFCSGKDSVSRTPAMTRELLVQLDGVAHDAQGTVSISASGSTGAEPSLRPCSVHMISCMFNLTLEQFS